MYVGLVEYEGVVVEVEEVMGVDGVGVVDEVGKGIVVV